MAAVNTAESVDTRLMRATYDRFVGKETSFRSRKSSDSDIRRTKSHYTDLEGVHIQQNLLDRQIPDAKRLAAGASPASSINGSVVEVLTEHVDIACNAGGRTVRLLLPKSLVPEELHIYGTPVRLMLSDKEGRRTPIVEGRSLEKIDLTDEERDALSWLDEDES